MRGAGSKERGGRVRKDGVAHFPAQGEQRDARSGVLVFWNLTERGSRDPTSVRKQRRFFFLMILSDSPGREDRVSIEGTYERGVRARQLEGIREEKRAATKANAEVAADVGVRSF